MDVSSAASSVPRLDRGTAGKEIAARNIDAAVIDVSALQLLLAALTGWLDRRERRRLRI